MNLTRRILEGIIEVELQITPEFQKPGEPGYVLPADLRDEINAIPWVWVETSPTAPITVGNRVMIGYASEVFPEAPQWYQVEEYLVAYDLATKMTSSSTTTAPPSWGVWPADDQAPYDFVEDVRELLHDLEKHL